MHRREFLHPRSLARSAGHVAGLLGELRFPDDAAEPEEVVLLRFSRRAMATTFEVILPFGTPDARPLAEAALDLIDRLEDQLTVYRVESEVSRLNRTAPHAAVPVEEGLFRLLTRAAQLTAETHGAFDVAVGALIKAWGFFRGPKRVPTKEERAAALARSGMAHVVLDPAARSVRYLREGLEINLGSIGKGYALDCVAELLRRDIGLSTALLHGGTSSVCALGSEPGSPHGWTVGLPHPWEPDRRLGMVRLKDQALGTSAATFQHLEWQGRKLGHILDPRTGWPAEGVASVSVVAPTAAEADALATAFYILGPDPARAYCELHPGVGAVMLPAGEGARPLVFGLAPEQAILFDS
jgi:thiamine biosynthesis lipoprotein